MSGHAFWDTPLEVALEMLEDDLWDRMGEAEAERAANFTRPIPRPTHTSTKHLVKCADCGCQGLEWKETPHGMRLVYAAAPKSQFHILGKIHACPDE